MKDNCKTASAMPVMPNVRKWIETQKEEENFYLMQQLSIHGNFMKYMNRIRKFYVANCIHEEKRVLGNAEHTFCFCTRWKRAENTLEK